MSKKKNPRREFWRTTHLFVENAVTNNIVLIQALGLCPIIAAGTTLQNGVALTVCTAVVLIPLSLFIALAGNWLPKWLRPVIYVLLASLLLVGAAYVMETYISAELFAKLHLFIPLMAVNMLYTRSVGFSSIVNPVATVVDALGSTVGFGAVICAVSALREMAVYGSLWGISLGWERTLSATSAPFAAYLLLGFLAALLQWSRQRISAFFRRKEEDEE
jgi:electron transport complex protein RnfE